MTDSAVSTPEQPAPPKINGNSARPVPAQEGRPRQFRLLVVDDDASIREVTSAMLAELDYKIETAEDGDAALKVMEEFYPDLVITDLRMPRMSGFELLEVLRRRFPQLPVIAISGEFTGESLPPGVIADAFLSKGDFAISRLRKTIAELLSISPMRAQMLPLQQPDHPDIDGNADMREVFSRLGAVEKSVDAVGLGLAGRDRNGSLPPDDSGNESE